MSGRQSERNARWSEMNGRAKCGENPAPEGRLPIARRFSAGVSGRYGASPGGTTEFSRTLLSPVTDNTPVSESRSRRWTGPRAQRTRQFLRIENRRLASEPRAHHRKRSSLRPAPEDSESSPPKPVANFAQRPCRHLDAEPPFRSEAAAPPPDTSPRPLHHSQPPPLA